MIATNLVGRMCRPRDGKVSDTIGPFAWEIVAVYECNGNVMCLALAADGYTQSNYHSKWELEPLIYVRDYDSASRERVRERVLAVLNRETAYHRPPTSDEREHIAEHVADAVLAAVRS